MSREQLPLEEVNISWFVLLHFENLIVHYCLMSISTTNVSATELLIEYIYNFTWSCPYIKISETVQVFNRYGVENYGSTILNSRPEV